MNSVRERRRRVPCKQCEAQSCAASFRCRGPSMRTASPMPITQQTRREALRLRNRSSPCGHGTPGTAAPRASLVPGGRQTCGQQSIGTHQPVRLGADPQGKAGRPGCIRCHCHQLLDGGIHGGPRASAPPRAPPSSHRMRRGSGSRRLASRPPELRCRILLPASEQQTVRRCALRARRAVTSGMRLHADGSSWQGSMPNREAPRGCTSIEDLRHRSSERIAPMRPRAGPTRSRSGRVFFGRWRCPVSALRYLIDGVSEPGSSGQTCPTRLTSTLRRPPPLPTPLPCSSTLDEEARRV